MTITELAIKRPSLIIVIFLALTLLGIFGYTQLRYELLPSISIPVISVTTVYPGASATEVESGVTKKIEDAVSTIDKVDTVQSFSQEGVSFVIIEFKQDVNLDFALQDAQRKVNQVLVDLPSGAKVPTISKISVNDLPVLRIGATSAMHSAEFYQLLKDQVRPSLSRIEGAGQVTLIGGDEREIKVNVDSQKLRSYGLSIVQVLQAVKASNLDFPTGTVKDNDGQFVVRLAGKFSSLEQLKQLIVGKSRAGGDIKLSDLAEVEDGRKDYTTINRINGKTSVGIMIQKQTDANTVDVCKLVRRELAKLETQYKEVNLKFDIAQDSSTFTIDSANAVKKDLGIAVLLVALVMLVFLHSIRNSFIVLVAIPTSLVSTIIGMWIFNFSLNLVTLLALSLVIGILVDDSIVVLENIHRHLESGEDKRRAALNGRNEIGFTALSISMVDVVVFVPLAMVTGVIGGVMREFAVVVISATLMSLFVSFTVTPMLASRFTKIEQLTKGSLLGRFGLWFEGRYEQLTRNYLKLLKWGLGNQGKVLLTAAIMFCATISLIPMGFIGAEFIPNTDRDEFSITIELAPGTKLEQTNEVTQQVEEILARFPEVRKIFTEVGASSSGFLGQSSNNVSTLNVLLAPKSDRKRSTEEIAFLAKAQIQKIPGIKSRVELTSIWGNSNMTPVAIVIKGPSWNKVYRAAKQVEKIMLRTPGTSDVRLSSEEGKPETRVEIDREKMAALGLTVADVGTTLRVGLTGDDESTYRDKDGTEYTTRIVLDQFDRSRTADIGNLTVANRSGQPVELKQFSQIYQDIGPTQLQRRDRSYAITVYSQVIGRTSGSVGQDIVKAMARENLPAGVSYALGGDLEQQADSFYSLGVVMIAAIIFVYLVMVALYDSFIYPFVVLFSVPLGVIGALLAIALTANSLNIMTILGIIMQIGLVSKNAILLVDFTNKARSEGSDAREALIWAGRERLRPILMTTLTMILGMLPIALSNAPGAEFKQGLGWALIGGLTCSMLMTLLVVPVVYLKVDQWRQSLIGFRKNRLSGNKLSA
ncbi:MAG: efflux RND transporter permease subunit [Bacillota bacterium]